MSKIAFSPAFPGDEYHAPGFSIVTAGEYDVDEDRASYLVETFVGRFGYAASAPAQVSQPVPETAPEDPQSTSEPAPEESQPISTTVTDQKEEGPAETVRPVETSESGTKKRYEIMAVTDRSGL